MAEDDKKERRKSRKKEELVAENDEGKEKKERKEKKVKKSASSALEEGGKRKKGEEGIKRQRSRTMTSEVEKRERKREKSKLGQEASDPLPKRDREEEKRERREKKERREERRERRARRATDAPLPNRGENGEGSSSEPNLLAPPKKTTPRNQSVIPSPKKEEDFEDKSMPKRSFSNLDRTHIRAQLSPVMKASPRGHVLGARRAVPGSPKSIIRVPMSQLTTHSSPKPKVRASPSQNLNIGRVDIYLPPGEYAGDAYRMLRRAEKTESGNPNKFELLEKKTQEAIIDAGIDGQEAEKFPWKWDVLCNCLRFLKHDSALKFSSKPTAMPEIDELDEAEMLEGDPPPHLVVGEEIGEGAGGRVFVGSMKGVGAGPEGVVAVKKMDCDDQHIRVMNFNELEKLKRMDSPHVVKLHHAYFSRSELWFVLEYLEGHPLSFHENGVKNEAQIAYVAHGILTALSYVHSEKLVHRDLKSENIMMTSEGDIKLIDFGLTADTTEGDLIQMCGSPFWLSPEMVKMAPHSLPTDIWSFGISLMEMMNGHPPHDDNPLGYIYHIGTLSWKGVAMELTVDDLSKWSPNLHGFLRHVLQPNPSERATISTLLQHPFLSNIISREEFAAFERESRQ